MSSFKASDIYKISYTEYKELAKYLTEHLESFEDAEDVDDFLDQNVTEKSITKRVIAYLYRLEIIKDLSKAGECIAAIIKNYNLIVKEKMAGFEKALDALEGNNDKATIKSDLDRTFQIFEKSCNQLKISPETYENKYDLILRLTAMIILSDTEHITYMQGYDRFTLTFYAMALRFAQENEINTDYAEAIAYEITRKVKRINHSANVIENSVTYEPFMAINDYIEREREDIVDAFDQIHITSDYTLYFAMSWRLSFFADVHEIKHTLLIFDNYFKEIPNVENLFVAAALAHINQIEIDNPNEVTQEIQNFKDYNIIKIVDDINRFLNDTSILPCEEIIKMEDLSEPEYVIPEEVEEEEEKNEVVKEEEKNEVVVEEEEKNEVVEEEEKNEVVKEDKNEVVVEEKKSRSLIGMAGSALVYVVSGVFKIVRGILSYIF